MDYISQDVDIERTYLKKCVICSKITEQIIEEFLREYFPFDSANPKPGVYFKEYPLAWYCTECNNFGEEVICEMY